MYMYFKITDFFYYTTDFEPKFEFSVFTIHYQMSGFVYES